MEGKLKLNDLLGLTNEELLRTKICLNTYNGDKHPIDEFKKNPQNILDWNYWNNKSYRPGQISIGLVNMGYHRWLLCTIGIIKKELDTPIDWRGNPSTNGEGIQVEYETLDKYQDLFGRVVVRFHNKAQNMFRNALPLIEELCVSEILPSLYKGFEFPGYDKVCLSYEELLTIINGDYPDYHRALENQKAVYVQTDKATGKLYVGSATAKNGMLLKRWTDYAKTGHGGNEDLKELNFDYIKQNFQYTIIENYNAKVDDEYIRQREIYWKKVLQSVKCGYNKNY